MADTQGLFGPSPQELAMQQQAAMQAQGNAYAAQDPFARANSLLYQGGQGLGNAIGGMLGGKDPQMVTAAKIAAIVKNGDQTTPEGMMAIAKQFAAEGLSGPASLAQQKAQEMQLGQAKMGLVAAQTKQAEARATKYESEAEKAAAGGIGGLGKINPNLYTPSSVADYAASLESGSPDYTVLVPRDPIARTQALSSAGKQAAEEGNAPGSPEFVARVKEINLAKGAEKPASAAVAKELGSIAQKQTVLQESGKKLAELAPQVQSLDLGLVSNWFRQGAAAIGVNTQDRITFDKIKREMLSEANNLLLAAKGTQTEGDAQRARDQIADENTWKNKDALSAAIQGLIDTHQRSVAAFEANAGVLKQAGKPASQINMAPAAAAPAPMAAKPAAAAVVDYAAAFARAKQLNPAWAKFTLEQFTAKAKQQGK
jgi:hypothetical protein